MSRHTHPKGLRVLFMTEMWERFSFYGLKALLVLYLTSVYSWTDARAYTLFAAYAALVYASPVLGGLIADRILGFKKSIFLGAVLIMLGHFCLALSWHALFYLGLAFVVCGTGYLKSCITSLVGELYDLNDVRRNAGFTIFYMGINLGAFLAGIAVGFVAKWYGWHYGFGLAGLGMLIGLLTFATGQRHLEQVGLPPTRSELHVRYFPGVRLEVWVWILSFLTVPLVAYLLMHAESFAWFMGLMGVISAAMIVVLAKACDADQRRKLAGLVVLIVFAVGFFSLFEQAASSINLFTDRGVDRVVLGWEIPTPAFQSLNPLYILILAPLFAMMWVRLAQRGWEPSVGGKFFLGLLLVSVGFIALALGASSSQDHARVSLWWLVIAYLVQTFGELCLSPVGLASVTRFAPPGSVGMMMGIWFLAMSMSNYLAGIMAKLAAVTRTAVDVQQQYAQAFWQVAMIGLAVSVLMLAVTPTLKKWLR